MFSSMYIWSVRLWMFLREANFYIPFCNSILYLWYDLLRPVCFKISITKPWM